MQQLTALYLVFRKKTRFQVVLHWKVFSVIKLFKPYELVKTKLHFIYLQLPDLQEFGLPKYMQFRQR
jgi:hypothetical protein